MAELINSPELRFAEFTKEWKNNKLGSIATFTKGKGISKSDIAENGELECIRYGELYTEYEEVITEIKSRTNLDPKNLVLSEENDVIIPASGETLIDIATASCVLKSGVALSGDLNIIKSPMNGIFLSFYLNNRKKKNIARLAQGISVVHLYSSQLKSLKLNIPTKEEQQKITSFLTSVDNRIQLLEQKKEKLEDYKKGIMQKIFNQDIRFKDENGNDFPDWEETKLGKLFYSAKGKGLSKNKIDETGIYNCILYGELYTTYSEVITKVVNKTNSTEGELSKKGDLLIPSSTTTTGIDLANVTALNIEDVRLGGDITVLRSDKEISNVFYAYYLSNYKKYEIAKFAQGITIVHLYYNHIKVMTIDKPCFNEQQKIAVFLTTLDENIDTINNQIDDLRMYKQGLLQKMFV